MYKHVFLTGQPGVGKTTLVRKACETLAGSGEILDGFYTEEVRERGRRVGFDVVTQSGNRGRLSRVGDSSTHSAGRQYRVGPYVVDLLSFENLVLPLFRNVGVAAVSGGKKSVLVVDEVGKMELFSQPFARAVKQALKGNGCSILGTIPVPKGKRMALIEEVRNRSDVKVFTVTEDNRDVILQYVVAAVQECVKAGVP